VPNADRASNRQGSLNRIATRNSRRQTATKVSTNDIDKLHMKKTGKKKTEGIERTYGKVQKQATVKTGRGTRRGKSG